MRILIYNLLLSLSLAGCFDWKKLNPLKPPPKATKEPHGALGNSAAAKDCVGAFPNSSVGKFEVQTNFPFHPDCSYIFQYPDDDVAIGVLETLGREQIIWFRFKKGLPPDGSSPIEEGFAAEESITASLDHAEFNLHKEYPKGDPLSGTVTVERQAEDVHVSFDLVSTVKLKHAGSLGMKGKIIVPNTIEFSKQLSH